MSDSLQARIRTALAGVMNSRVGTDVISAEMVRDVAATTEGKVRLTLLLAPDDEATLVRDVYRAVAAVDGVTDVRVDPKDVAEPRPQAHPHSHTHSHAGAAGGPPAQAAPRRALPVMDATPKAPPAKTAAPTPVAYPHLGRIIAVSSGKGGVGKSTVATNLAVALACAGYRVGLMDADIYGPNVPRMLGVQAQPAVVDQRIIPLEAHGVKVISLGFLIPRDQPAIWRGPIVMKVVTQFLQDVAWGTLDYLVVDMPPGTGDAQLSLVQATQVHGALIVTTPQEVSVGDALRGVRMFETVKVPVLGIVENMSWYECPHCGKPSPIFGSGGGDRLAREVGLPLLAQIPLDPRVGTGGDSGQPAVVATPESPAARALTALAGRVAEALPALGPRVTPPRVPV